MASTACMKLLEEALAMQELEPGIFKTVAHSDYCYGDWAWGGFLASLVQEAAVQYATAHGRADSHHTDVCNIQIQYLRPVLSKEISISVRIGRVTKSMSTLHVAIIQDGKECVAGYVNVSDLSNMQGPTFDTGWNLHPVPTPANLVELENNTSPDWIRYATPYTRRGWFRLQSLVHFMLPIQLARPSIAEEWITPTDSRNTFTNNTLGMVADLWSPFIENFNPESTVQHSKLIEIAKQQKCDPNGKSGLSDTLQRQGWTSSFVLTTLSMTLEIKQRLPPSGVKWLYVRAYAKMIHQGKFDIEVVIMDENMDLVAVSQQMAVAADFRPELRDKARFDPKSKV